MFPLKWGSDLMQYGGACQVRRQPRGHERIGAHLLRWLDNRAEWRSRDGAGPGNQDKAGAAGAGSEPQF